MRMRQPLLIRLPACLAGKLVPAGLRTGVRRETPWRGLEMTMRRLFRLVINRPLARHYSAGARRTTVLLVPIAQLASTWAQQRTERELRTVKMHLVVRELDRSGGTHVVVRDRAAGLLAPELRAAPARREGAATYPRVDFTMVRTPAAVAAAAVRAAAGPAPITERTAAAGQPRREAVRQAFEPAGLPPQELSRVTDHVIRQLDRRVLSYRERTGRIV
jgi:hypothetical protein